MGRISELVGQQAVDRGPTCKIHIILNEYPPAERAEWDAVFSDVNIPTAQVARAFRADGHDIAASTLMRHVRRECACG